MVNAIVLRFQNLLAKGPSESDVAGHEVGAILDNSILPCREIRDHPTF